MHWSNCGHLLQHGWRAARVIVVVVVIDVHAYVFGRIICHISVTVARVHVSHFIAAAPRVASGEDPLERFPEFRVEYRIDDGIKSGIRVAQPGEDFKRLAPDACFAKCGHNIYTKEGHPADQEHPHYYAHSYRRFMVGHMVGGRVLLELFEFHIFILMRFRAPNTAVVLLFRNFSRPGYRPDRFHVLLGVTI